MMGIRLLIYLCVFFSGGLVQTLVWNRITREVNQCLPDDEQYSVSIWSLRRPARGGFNQLQIWSAHRRFFPESYLRLWCGTALVLTVSWMFLGLSVVNL